MKSNTMWSFSSPIDSVDVLRILKEAGPRARAIRLTIDGKIYTLVNVKRAVELPFSQPVGQEALEVGVNTYDGFPVRGKVRTKRGSNGEPVIVVSGFDKSTKWRLYVGDVTGPVVDKVETTVEVF